MTLRTALRSAALAAILVALDSAQLGCGQPAPPAVDAGAPIGPRTAFGQISPQGGTVTGIYGSGNAIVGGSNGGVVYLRLGDCLSGSAWVSLGSGSGYACASAGTPSTAGSGELLVQGSGELDGYGGSACPTGQLVQSIDSAGDLGCSLPIASNACGSGWAAAIGSDGALACSVPTSSAVAPGVVSSTMTTNNWAPTGFGPNIGTVYMTSGGTLTGIDSTSAYDGMRVVFVNLSGGTLTVSNYNSGSLAANRIICPDAITQQVANEGFFELEYLTSATAALPGWYMIDWNGGFANINSLTASASVTAASAAITGAITAGSTAFRADGAGVYAAPSGSDVYANYQYAGFNDTFHAVSTFIDDGQGAGSAAHAIVLFDAHTHSVRVGSAGSGNPADIESSSAAPAGSCGSGSIDQDYASGGTLYVCNSGTWRAAASWSASIANNTLLLSDGAGNIIASTVTDTGSLFMIPEALTQAGATNINTTGTAVTTIGNSSGGNTNIQAGTSATLNIGTASKTIQLGPSPSTTGNFGVDIEGGSASQADGIFIAANYSNGAPVTIGSTTSGASNIQSGSDVTISGVHGIRLGANGHLFFNGSAPSLSSGSCGVTQCNDNVGDVLPSSGASSETITWSHPWVNAPVCVIHGSSNTNPYITGDSTTTLTISSSGATFGGASFMYICFGDGAN